MRIKIKLVFLTICVFFIFGCSIFSDAYEKKIETNQKIAINQIYQVVGNQLHSLDENGVLKKNIEDVQIPQSPHYGYSYEMKTNGKRFEIWALPLKYGTNGRDSFYYDSKTRNIHGADKKGERASKNDPVVEEVKFQEKSKPVL